MKIIWLEILSKPYVIHIKEHSNTVSSIKWFPIFSTSGITRVSKFPIINCPSSLSITEGLAFWIKHKCTYLLKIGLWPTYSNFEYITFEQQDLKVVFSARSEDLQKW